MRLLRKFFCLVVVAFVSGLANLACEPETTVSRETHTSTATEPRPVLEGD